MTHRILYILLTLIGVGVNAKADSTVLTIDECRQMALANNTAIRNSSLQSAAARELRKEAFTKYFPEVGAAGMAFTTNHRVINYDLKGKVPIPPIPELLPQGGELPYSFGLSMIKKGVMAGATLVQPVFMGGMIVNGNKLAEVGEAVAELQSRQSADQVRATVEQYYWQLASLKAKRATVNELMALLDTLERQVNAAVNAGVVLRNELLEVQLRHNEMATVKAELDNGISVMSTLLGQYIGMGLEPVDIADCISPDNEAPAPESYYVVPADALSQTTDYRLLSANVRAADLEKRMKTGEYLPKAGIGAGYFYHNILDQGHGFGAIFATVAVPISGWWGGSHAIKQAKLRVQIAKNRLEDDSQLLEVKMINSYNSLTTAYDKIAIARLSIDQAAENLRLNENYYRVGTVTVSDLLKAQTLYRQARDSFVDAYGDYQVKTVEYLQSTGR